MGRIPGCVQSLGNVLEVIDISELFSSADGFFGNAPSASRHYVLRPVTTYWACERTRNRGLHV